jgi:hypothetical protein
MRKIAIVIVCFIVFIVFFIALLLNVDNIGGDALNGYKNSEGYFIQTDDGYVKVSSNIWYFNRFLFISALITGISSGIGFIYLMVRHALPFFAKFNYKDY